MMKLYIYEHCPYCTKARMVFGLKNVPVELKYLQNDDEQTPIGLVGVKMLPILVDQDGGAIGESLDIVDFIDRHYYPTIIEKKTSHTVDAWLSENSSIIYKLAMPRWIQASMPEFETQSARSYFTEKKEKSLGSFHEHLQLTEQYLQILDQSWFNLTNGSDFFDVDQRPIQLGDLHLFAALKSLTIVKDIEIPEEINIYINRLSIQSQVSLNYEQAL